MDRTEEALGNLDWNTLPIGANPKVDRRMPDDELGRARFQTSGGRVYSISMSHPQEDRGFESEPGTFDRVKDVAKRYATGLLEEIEAAGNAPARAARGEPVQVGEAMSTASMATLGVAAMPQKLLRPKHHPQPEVTTEELFDLDFESLDDVEGVGYTPFKVPESLEEALSKVREDISFGLLQEEWTILYNRAVDKQKILEQFGDDWVVQTAKDLPHYNDPAYFDYVDKVVKPAAREVGASEYNVMELVHDIGDFFPQKTDPRVEQVATRILPYKQPIGQRASADAPKRPSDSRAEALGFRDTVYHSSVSPDEFSIFNIDYNPHGNHRNAHDLLGIHVGTPRAAAERNMNILEINIPDGAGYGHTMELRARTDKPVTKADLTRVSGIDPGSLTPQKTLTELDLGEMISAYADKHGIEDVSDASIKLRRELSEEGYTHIPYKNDVEDPGSTSFIMLVDRPKGDAAVLRDVRAQFDPEQISNPDLRFSDGGLTSSEVPDKQKGTPMIERDPISGNEVPPGGRPEEVRDDIDAKLSDGEYVLPADVVRFYGVQHIEKMVQKAKEGMTEMVSNGRVNGEDPRQQAVPPGVPNGGPPSGDPTVRKFAGGGYNTEYQFAPQPTMPGDAPIAMDGYSAAEELRRRQEAPVQMADGGYTSAANQIMSNQSYGTGANQILNTGGISGFDAVRSMGRGFYGSNAVGGTLGGGAGGVETRTYINSAGERISIMFINGTPLSDIPDGFFPDNEETRKMFAEQNTRGEDVADPSQQWDEDGRDSAESNGRNKVDPYSTADTNPFTMSPEQALGRAQELAKTAAGGGIMEGLGKVPGTIGAVAGTLGKVGQVNAYNELQALKTAIDKRGGLGINESIDALIEEVASDVPTPKRESGFITPTDKFYERFETGLTGLPYQSVVDNYPAIVNEHTGQPTTSTGGTTGGGAPATGGAVPPRTTGVNRYNIAPGQQWTLDSPYQNVEGGYRATESDVNFLRDAGANDLRAGDHLTDIEVAMLHNRDAGLSLSNDAGLDRAQAIRDIQRATNTTPTWSGEGRDDRERSWDGGAVAGEEGSRATSSSAPSTSRTAEQAREAAQRAADRLDVGLATGGRAKGGLVSRKHAYKVPRRKIRTVER